MNKVGWSIFLFGFLLGAIASIPHPSESISVRSPEFVPGDINTKQFVEESKSPNELAKHLQSFFDESTRQLIASGKTEELEKILTREFNTFLGNDKIASTEVPEIKTLVASSDSRKFYTRWQNLKGYNPKSINKEREQELIAAKQKLEQKTLSYVNRLVIEQAYPKSISPIASFPAYFLIIFASIISIVGLGTIHTAERRRKAALSGYEADGESAEVSSAHQYIKKVVTFLKDADFAGSEGEKLKEEIEKLQFEYIVPLTDQREAIAYSMGLEKFALMFSDFATGERYVNRAWSAIVDNHRDECLRSLEVAQGCFEEALKKA